MTPDLFPTTIVLDGKRVKLAVGYVETDAKTITLTEGLSRKERGMTSAAAQVPTLLKQAQTLAVNLALDYGFVSADDVYSHLTETEQAILGNAAGSLFKPKERWVFVDWVPSTRPSNHGRMIRRWALRP